MRSTRPAPSPLALVSKGLSSRSWASLDGLARTAGLVIAIQPAFPFPSALESPEARPPAEPLWRVHSRRIISDPIKELIG
jgi:hypothetical protein